MTKLKVFIIQDSKNLKNLNKWGNNLKVPQIRNKYKWGKIKKRINKKKVPHLNNIYKSMIRKCLSKYLIILQYQSKMIKLIRNYRVRRKVILRLIKILKLIITIHWRK